MRYIVSDVLGDVADRRPESIKLPDEKRSS